MITFTKADRRRHAVSVGHTDTEVDDQQAARMGADYLKTMEEDQRKAYLKVLGKVPKDRQIKRSARVHTMQPEKGPRVHLLRYRRRAICAWTDRMSTTEKNRLVSYWYFKIL